MVRNFLFHIFLVEIGTLTSDFARATVVNIDNGEWSGVGFYISVRRNSIQSKLDEVYKSASQECFNGPRLFVPDVSVLPELHNVDRHPVFIGFGHVKVNGFDEYLRNNPNPSVSVSGVEVTVTIPFLARSSSGPPKYAFGLAQLFEKDRGDIPKQNILYPYIPVDEIILTDNGASVRSGSEEMRVSFNRIDQANCTPPGSIVKKEFETFVNSEFQLGLPSPDYSFCDRHSLESQYCENLKRTKFSVSHFARNVCQKWSAVDMVQCATTMAIEKITSWFRDFILLGDDPVNILASESVSSNYTLALKYPCEE